MESTKLSYTAAVIDSRLGKVDTKQSVSKELKDLKDEILSQDQEISGKKTFTNIEIKEQALADYSFDDSTDEKTLTTKKYVDDLIAEIDARSDVVAVVGTHDDLLNYQEKITKNDIVKVLTDETQNDKTSYYRYPANAKKGEVDPNKWQFVGAVTQYALTSELTSEAETRENADNSLSQAISEEANRATNAESNLSNSLSEAAEKITNHIADTNNPHSVTKGQVGLSNVSNTADSATPEENGDKKFTTGGAYSLKTALETAINAKYTKPSSGIPASDLKDTYVVANSNITASTGTKITYDAKGLVTSSTSLSASDIPNLETSKITSGTFSDDKIASASTWNAKQDAISDLADIRSNAEAGKAAKDQIGHYTVKSNVPENAVFTDTTYTAGDNITILNNKISAKDTTYSDVTDSSHGLMTSDQKKKLDSVAEGAEVNVQSDWNTSDTSSDSYIKNKPTLSISNGKITIGENSITPITSLDGYAKTTDLSSYSKTDHTHAAKLEASSETGTSLSAGSTYKLTAGGNSVIFKMPEAGGIEVASDTSLGGIKIGYSESEKNYAVKLDNQKAYVTVPWENTTYSTASTTNSGLMSDTDKTNLDNLVSLLDGYSEETLTFTSGTTTFVKTILAKDN